MSLVASGKICPPELVERLIQMERVQLEEEPYGPLMLVVRAPTGEGDDKFLQALMESVKKDTRKVQPPRGWVPTSEFPTLPVRSSEPSEEDQIELLSELAAAPHCIVPLRGSRRCIRVGRSIESDIVMNDPSISGDHARLDLTDGGVRLSDEQSKNGTTLNGRSLRLNDKPWLQPMDRLTFGRVTAFVCAPIALRGVLRQDLRTLL